jgi:hypothetical protein
VIAAILLFAAQSDLAQRVAEVVATPSEEKWLTVPWRTDLTTARRDSQREDKPIFLWIMNGHPMGCT